MIYSEGHVNPIKIQRERLEKAYKVFWLLLINITFIFRLLSVSIWIFLVAC